LGDTLTLAREYATHVTNTHGGVAVQALSLPEKGEGKIVRTVASTKILWGQRTRTLATCVLAVLVAATICVLLGVKDAHAAPATFTVNTTADTSAANDGACQQPISVVDRRDCTLREAINAANSNSNPAEQDLIRFSIQGNGPHTISVGEGTPSLGELPTITQPASIDGYTEPLSSPNTAATGTNAVLKIVLDGSKAGSSAAGLLVRAPNTTVRGLVINNGFRAGVHFRGQTPSDAGNTLEGCFIGTDVSGEALPTSGTRVLDGVIIRGGEANVIGGTTLDTRNLISGIHASGVRLLEPATGNRVEGNLIGTKKDGTTALGNGGNGVLVAGGAGNTIGGAGAARNTIAFNGHDGVLLIFDPSTGNSILFNSIYNNGELGIDLEGSTDNASGVTPNDFKDPDIGPNSFQNFPVISSATTFGATTTIRGSLNSTPNQTFTVQFFSSPAPDPSGFGEGKTFIGQRSVLTNFSGNAFFTLAPNKAVPVGHRVTATATGVGGTSEFSRARLVERPVIEE
jgi:CSLREA domain-containing protein